MEEVEAEYLSMMLKKAKIESYKLFLFGAPLYLRNITKLIKRQIYLDLYCKSWICGLNFEPSLDQGQNDAVYRGLWNRDGPPIG